MTVIFPEKYHFIHLQCSLASNNCCVLKFWSARHLSCFRDKVCDGSFNSSFTFNECLSTPFRIPDSGARAWHQDTINIENDYNCVWKGRTEAPSVWSISTRISSPTALVGLFNAAAPSGSEGYFENDKTHWELSKRSRATSRLQNFVAFFDKKRNAFEPRRLVGLVPVRAWKVANQMGPLVCRNNFWTLKEIIFRAAGCRWCGRRAGRRATFSKARKKVAPIFLFFFLFPGAAKRGSAERHRQKGQRERQRKSARAQAKSSCRATFVLRGAARVLPCRSRQKRRQCRGAEGQRLPSTAATARKAHKAKVG